MKIEESKMRPLPDSIKETILDMAYKHAKLLPPWIELLTIGYYYDGEGYASSRADKAYLRHNIEFESAIMGEDEECIEATMLHEIAHAWTNPVYDAALHHAEDTVEDESQVKVLKTILSRELEMSTEGLANLFGRLLNEDRD